MWCLPSSNRSALHVLLVNLPTAPQAIFRFIVHSLLVFDYTRLSIFIQLRMESGVLRLQKKQQKEGVITLGITERRSAFGQHAPF